MRYPPEQIESLAGEYVLGTLHGRARRRFESLMRDRADVRYAVWVWERSLHGMAANLAPVQPRRRVWKTIRRRVGRSQPARSGTLTWFRWAATTLPAVAVVAWLAMTQVFVPAPDRMAVFAAADAAAMWIVNADLDEGVLMAEAIAPPDTEANSSYELWVLPATGNPVSMGLMQTDIGSWEASLSDQALESLADSVTLAISVEPQGGSPTGLPTGPVVYTADLVRL